MKVKIQTLHFNADKNLELFIHERMDKLVTRHQNIVLAEVTLRLDKAQTNENKIAEIRLEVPGNNLFAKKQSKTFEEAADTAVEALQRQLKKYKDKRSSK
ncbi:MAG: ribosomal subunit interface protein [Bacteroidetes bacterium CG02_land_8_20_14_3_00_31_25]|nr:ribosome-associated translation inhibitor RaiA [Bacteroidota bacterium]PIV58615.1 MAG: ribosomal subunit interface protein [Bacteroidetes bacterium CG02_land_8_20_14_3_00_31_25]PIX35494.1 MAG: ribosomal subunit interface protein [Bacteroidetes bacterium CG_4_8_14_3_um_filter_31_14]PIY04398.1 MAG: ribosomal subunit interface protein [Bacteroidetes bacterium CG_4_10_14_3_um_filter_31_20]